MWGTLKYSGNARILDTQYLDIINRRMLKCNTVLQSEIDLFQPKIQPNSHGNCEFLALIRTIKSSKCFGHCPVKNNISKTEYDLEQIIRFITNESLENTIILIIYRVVKKTETHFEIPNAKQ